MPFCGRAGSKVCQSWSPKTDSCGFLKQPFLVKRSESCAFSSSTWTTEPSCLPACLQLPAFEWLGWTSRLGACVLISGTHDHCSLNYIFNLPAGLHGPKEGPRLMGKSSRMMEAFKAMGTSMPALRRERAWSLRRWGKPFLVRVPEGKSRLAEMAWSGCLACVLSLSPHVL